jgi:RNA polymerase sigma-70 factor (ECF subfamily)
MTGNRADADDLTQESITKAIERADQLSGPDPTGWLLRLTTHVCLDHLRRASVRRRVTELVDLVDAADGCQSSWSASPENALVVRGDVRYAIVVALQTLSGRQRAALILRDVCERSLEEIAATLGSNENAVKALLGRARRALAEARGPSDVDVPADPDVVERFARAVEAGSVESIAELLAEDVWGMVDGGGVVVTASKPTFGKHVVVRQWANAKTKVPVPVTAQVQLLNDEAVVVVRVKGVPELIVAVVHLETRRGRVVAQRVLRDPVRIQRWASRRGDATVTLGW